MSSSEIHNSAEAMRELAQQLQRFVDRVVEFDQGIAQELRRLGDTFRDDGYTTLCADFEQAQRQLRECESAIRGTVPELIKDAEAIESYLRERIDP